MGQKDLKGRPINTGSSHENNEESKRSDRVRSNDRWEKGPEVFAPDKQLSHEEVKNQNGKRNFSDLPDSGQDNLNTKANNKVLKTKKARPMINLSEKSSDSEISKEFGKLNMGSGINEERRKKYKEERRKKNKEEKIEKARKLYYANKELRKIKLDAFKNDGSDKNYDHFDASVIFDSTTVKPCPDKT